jgi:hypothetical protein
MIFEKFVPSDVACVHTRDGVVHQELGVEIGNACSRRYSAERLTEIVDRSTYCARYSAKSASADDRRSGSTSSRGLARFGRGTIGFGTAGERQAWSLRREFIPPRYTTDWNELLRV